MNLSEKILHCRRKSGLSQEALADKLGVSRQAISKWETGTTSPEIDKLLLLANEFNVSTDWLLSNESTESSQEEQKPLGDAGETLPHFFRHLTGKYGWLAGLYLIFYGTGATVMGFYVRQFTSNIFLPEVELPFILRLFQIFSTLVLVFGIALIIGGIYLAVRLRGERKK